MVYTRIIIDTAEISEDLLIRLADELTNPKSLSTLGLAGSTSVKVHVLENLNTPLPMFELLSNDPAWEVRKTIAESPRASREVLLRLCEDENMSVRHSAKHTLKKFF